MKMDKQQVIQTLKEIVVKCMELNITPDQIIGANLSDELNFNSVDALEVLVWVENHFQIEIPDEDLNANLINCLDNFAEYLIAKKAG